jgi:peroxiredoxin
MDLSSMETASTLIGRYAPDFELPGTDGAVHHLARYLETHAPIAVVFMCNHCPYVKLYLDRIKQLHQTLQANGGIIIGINPNDEQQFPADSFEQMQAFAHDYQLAFPYLRDVTQDVATAFAAQKTPHLFLLDRQGRVCYQGAIDDQAQDPTAVTQSYGQTAIAQLLQGQPISTPSTDPIGCSVKWRQ